MPDLRPATRDELLHGIGYRLRFDRRGKATRRHNALMAELAAEAIVEMLEDAGYVVMMPVGLPMVPKAG